MSSSPVDPAVQELYDAARRLSDAVALHLTVNGHDAFQKWVAASLTDGSSDGVLYDSRDDAVRHTHNRPTWHIYVCIPPGGMPVNEAAILISQYRQWGGTYLSDHPDIILSQTETLGDRP